MISKIVVVFAMVAVLYALPQKPAPGTFDLQNGKPTPVRSGAAVPIPQTLPAPAQAHVHRRDTHAAHADNRPESAKRPQVDPISQNRPSQKSRREAQPQRTKDIPKRTPY